MRNPYKLLQPNIHFNGFIILFFLNKNVMNVIIQNIKCLCNFPKYLLCCDTIRYDTILLLNSLVFVWMLFERISMRA